MSFMEKSSPFLFGTSFEGFNVERGLAISVFAFASKAKVWKELYLFVYQFSYVARQESNMLSIPKL